MPHVYLAKNYMRVKAAKEAGFTTCSLQGSSRCFAKGTLVRMFNGTLKPIESIKVGDKVMNKDGNGYNSVIETHNGIDNLYTVHQARGIDYTVNSRHILSLKQTRAKQHKVAIPGYKSAEKRRIEMLPFDKSVICDFDISYYKAQSKNFQKRYTGFKNTDIELQEKELPIDPYYLGVWLGDGCAIRWYDITNTDKEIIDFFYSFAEQLGSEAYRVDKITHRIMVTTKAHTQIRPSVGIENYCKAFKELGLIGNKHIPDEYIYNSKKNRLKLLAGLIDTDGCKSGRNTLCITQKKECIIQAIEELCHITGFYTNGYRKEVATMKRDDGSIYKCEVYRIEINHNDFKELSQYMKVERKKVFKECDRDYYASSIQIERAGIGEYYGFTLDNSPYFLLKDGTVVHNSAKTYSVVQFLCMYCFNYAGTTVSIIRAGMPSIKRTVYRDFKDIMLNFGWWDDKCMNKSEFVYTFPNGSWIEFFSTDNEQKVRGSKRKILFVNEANELSFIEWQQLQMRTTEFSILDYNPSFSEDHWINQVNEEKSTYWFISTYKDNPFLEPKVIAEIESLKWKNPSLWRIYGLGLRSMVEGLVFENVIIDDYVPIHAKRHRYIGMDFGYANDSTAIVEVMLYGNNIYLNEICYKTHMLTDEIIATLKDIEGRPEIISESADPRLVDEIYNAGLDIKPVKKFGGSIAAGIMKMQQYKIHVTSKSINLRKEFNNYTWRQDKEGKWLNEPIDMWNHCFTGDTLILTEEGLKRIDSIQIGDKVMTSKGYRKVTHLFTQGCRLVRVVRFDFGNFAIEIQATPEHKFKTKKGWKELQKLTTSDTIYLSKSLMERNITFIMEKDISHEVHIDCTETYGSSIMELSQRDFTSIIKMRTLKIITLRTLNWSREENIYGFMRKSIYKMKHILQKLVRICTKHQKLPKNGIIQQKAENGIDYKGLKSLEIEQKKNTLASVVEVNSEQKHSVFQNSVQINAKANGEEIRDLIMKKGHASTVVRPSLQTNIAKNDFVVESVAKSISTLKEYEQPTYDIEVEDMHEFFANGILVHNCIDATRYVILEKVLGDYGSGMQAADILGLMG